MAVRYDRESDTLIYDRKLMDGPGNRMYGLEVCKSLYLPEQFLQQAYDIRTKYFPLYPPADSIAKRSDGFSITQIDCESLDSS